MTYAHRETTIYVKKFKTTHYGIQSIKLLAPKIWDLIPD